MHISNQLIDSFPLTYSPKSCNKENLSIPLEPHHKAQWNPLGKTILYICSHVDPSRSPCLKTIDRKSFERGSFLVLHPVRLKLHISNQLIDSFPLTYSPKSCNKEKLSIPLEPHHKAQSSKMSKYSANKLKELQFLAFSKGRPNLASVRLTL